LRQLEQMSSFWIDKLKNRPILIDQPMVQEEQPVDPSLPQIEPEKFAQLEELLELYGNCPEVQRAMREALEVDVQETNPTEDIV